MADPQAPKKPSKIPMILWGAVTVALLARTFWRPYRAVVQDGYPTVCPGSDSSCSPVMTIVGQTGATPVYAITSGIAAVGTDGSVAIASDREPYIISYGPGSSQIFVQQGQHVAIGQELCVMDTVQLSIQEVVRADDGTTSYNYIDPSAYLAARGLKVSAGSNVVSALWCSHGRNISVPTAALNCGLKLPEPSALMLLPVTVTTE